ncbi:MAG: hypothetical protein ACE368_03415 [Paracoccaceae bacterium]
MADSADQGTPDEPTRGTASGLPVPARPSGVPLVRRSTPGTKRPPGGAKAGAQGTAKKPPKGRPAGAAAGPRPAAPPKPAPDATVARAPIAQQAAAPVAPQPSAAPPSSGGIGPMILAGVVAAAVGAGGMFIAVRQGTVGVIDAPDGQAAEIAAMAERIEGQTDEISALRDELATHDAALETLRGEMTAGDADAGAARSAIEDRLAALAVEVEEAKARPIPEAQLPQEVVEAYERRLDEIRGSLDQSMAGIEARVQDSLAEARARLDEELVRIEEATSAAAELERAAEAAASAAAVRAALAELDTALDTGTGFAGPLAEIAERTGAAIPDVLTAAAAEGVPTQAALQAGFPEAARGALGAATRSAAESGEVGGLTAFVRTHLGARSLEPREGSDPDAILSRAEAALRSGDLDTALAEIAALPEDGRNEMSGWLAQANTRQAALAAARSLAAAVNSN